MTARADRVRPLSITAAAQFELLTVSIVTLQHSSSVQLLAVGWKEIKAVTFNSLLICV